MNKKEALEILNPEFSTRHSVMGREYKSFSADKIFVYFMAGEDTICLDDDFTINQLRAIIYLMENQNEWE